MYRAMLWKGLKGKRIQCNLCNHFCIIGEGEKGKCGVRVNKDGVLYTLVYDKVPALNIDPVEKKPVYHFLPATTTFSFGTMGCNLRCVFCQNYSLSQTPVEGGVIAGDRISPEYMVEAALRYGCKSISYTYSEPTVFFELMRDTAEMAIDRGIKNIMVSNGFMSEASLRELREIIHGANIDLKSFSEDFYSSLCGAKLKPVLKNLVHIKKMGWWLEITTLLIPGKNDGKDELRSLARFIVRELGKDVPWHISRFHPDYKLRDISHTPLKTLEMAYEIGKEEGLEFVYLGNVPSLLENTYCPECGNLLIKRQGFKAEVVGIKKGGRCIRCEKTIAGVWEV